MESSNPSKARDALIASEILGSNLISMAGIKRVMKIISSEKGSMQAALDERKEGPQLSKDEKIALGIKTNAYMSHEMFNELTSAGALRPIEAHVIAAARVASSLARLQTVKLADEFAFPQVEIVCASGKSCSHCETLDGKILQATDAFIQTPSECVNDYCITMLVNLIEDCPTK